MYNKKIVGILLSVVMLINLNVIGVRAATANKAASKTKALTKKVSKVTTKSSVTADVYKILAKANIATGDYIESCDIDYGQGIAENISTKYSKLSDCCIVTCSGPLKNTIYINYLHNPSKIEVYSYNATTKKYQRTDSTKYSSDKYIDNFILLTDASLRILVNNSKISVNKNNITLQSKLNKTALYKVMDDFVSSNPLVDSYILTNLQFTIIIKNGKLTQVNQIESLQSGLKKLTVKLEYKTGYSNQNVKPFKLIK